MPALKQDTVVYRRTSFPGGHKSKVLLAEIGRQSITDIDTDRKREVVGMESPQVRPASPTCPTDKSSWSLLKKLFKESNKLKQHDNDDSSPNNGKKSRRVSVDTNKDSSKSTIKRKSSGSSSSKLMRKHSVTNTQENLLHFAVIESDMSTLHKILEDDNRKIDVNYMRPPGLSALHQACVIGNLHVVELLLSSGADVSLKTWSELSPLQIATLFGHFDVAQFLIREGASPKEIQNGFTHDSKLMATVFVR